MAKLSQKKQIEWYEQWSLVQDDSLFLFQDWIYPYSLNDFSGKSVLECGCGGGQHTFFLAPYAKSITSVDLNAIAVAKERNNEFDNITFIDADILSMTLNKKFDMVFSIGVIHHTDDPDLAVKNMIRHVKKGGKVIIWVYSKEGNFLVRSLVEPMRKLFLTKMSRSSLLLLSKLITFLMYFPIYTIYLAKLKFLPYYEYFQNFRKLSFYRNVLNVFDKLNAPQVQFIDRSRAERWTEGDNKDVHISHYKGVSYRISFTKN